VSSAAPHYEVIYSVITAGYRWWPIVIFGFVALATCVAILLAQRRFPATVKRPWHRPVGIFVLAFVFSMSADAAWSTHRKYTELCRRLRAGEFDLVEGTVEGLIQAEGKTPEGFTVSGHRYAGYRSFDLTPGYHADVANGGTLRDGMQVRIADVDGAIARLEVLRSETIGKDSI
jgi:hypothetical protein